MIGLADFLPQVFLEADGCPEAVALNAVRNAVREFCQATELWAEDLDPISLYVDGKEYDLDPPAGASVVRVITAKYQGVPIAVWSELEMNESVSDWKAATGAGLSAVIPGYSAVRVYPIPTEAVASALVLHVALQPGPTGVQCADELMEYAEGISAGALARLKSIPNKPWSDRAAVDYYRGIFMSAIGDAKAHVLRGRSRRSLSVQPRAFA